MHGIECCIIHLFLKLFSFKHCVKKKKKKKKINNLAVRPVRVKTLQRWGSLIRPHDIWLIRTAL